MESLKKIKYTSLKRVKRETFETSRFCVRSTNRFFSLPRPTPPKSDAAIPPVVPRVHAQPVLKYYNLIFTTSSSPYRVRALCTRIILRCRLRYASSFVVIRDRCCCTPRTENQYVARLWYYYYVLGTRARGESDGRSERFEINLKKKKKKTQ